MAKKKTTTGGEAKPRAKKAKLELVQDEAQLPDAAEPAAEHGTPAVEVERPKRTRAHKSKPTAMTLAELAAKYVASLEVDGKSDATVNAYRSDLAIALRVLGADTAIDSIRPADVQRFNESDAVVRARTGAPKASPTIERTRRVLRLALDHAECEGWIAVSPCGCESAEVDA